MKVIYISGNGNTSFEDFQHYYLPHLQELSGDPEHHFIVGEFRGIDVLTLEFLKTKTANVSVYHCGEKPRYMPDPFRTHVREWKTVGGFKSDGERDRAAIERCTHVLAIDFNSDDNRKSGTQKNIERCLQMGKVLLLLPRG